MGLVSTNYQVAILGGGLYGSFLAYILTQKGYKVVVIDADSEDKELWGYSSTNFSWLRYRKIGGRSLHWGGNICLPTKRDLSVLEIHSNKNDDIEDLNRILGIEKRVPFPSEHYQDRIQVNKSAAGLRENIKTLKGFYVESLSLDGGVAVKAKLYDIKNKSYTNISADNFILACSPFENLNILLNSGASIPGLGENINDHLVCSYMVVVKDNTNQFQSFKFDKNILFELTGPFNYESLSTEEKEQINLEHENPLFFYMIHGFIKTDPNIKKSVHKFENKRPRIEWRLSDLDHKNIKNQEAILLNEAKCLFGDNIVDIFQTNDPLNSQNIPHESGGIVLGDSCDKNLKINGLDWDF